MKVRAFITAAGAIHIIAALARLHNPRAANDNGIDPGPGTPAAPG